MKGEQRLVFARPPVTRPRDESPTFSHLRGDAGIHCGHRFGADAGQSARGHRFIAARGKSKQHIVTAVARELSGFLWAALTQ